MSDDFEQMMRELRDDYVKSLPQKIADIESHLNAKMWSDIRNDFHKLKGTGRTYGVPEISTLCDVVEKICVKRPELIPTIVPKAAKMLASIHTKRVANQEFPIESEGDFKEIQKIAASLA